jgi:hypothetical protein
MLQQQCGSYIGCLAQGVCGTPRAVSDRSPATLCLPCRSVAAAAHATLLRVEQEAEEVQRTSTKLKLEPRDALNMVREAVTKASAPQVCV